MSDIPEAAIEAAAKSRCMLERGKRLDDLPKVAQVMYANECAADLHAALPHLRVLGDDEVAVPRELLQRLQVRATTFNASELDWPSVREDYEAVTTLLAGEPT